MLRLESLELAGFKSFAEKLQLDFHSEVTSIVGPNGCGKSNLFDAIEWVLGAQNARHLRGEKMEDLIFNGTGRRKQSGVAQVKLTIRLDEATPIVVAGKEFVQDRVEVCRKLYRTGESLYLINQRRCRLLDIQNILEEAGLGFSSYAFIAQGKIDHLLTGKPQDRRAVIEEAAGILAYKSRRRRAEVRLELAQQNLLRVNDIVTEIEKQLRSLRRQAAKARRYRELLTRFKEVRRIRFSLERERLAAELGAFQKEKLRLHRLETTAKQDLLQAEEEQTGRTRSRDQLEKGLSELRQKSTEARLETDRTENSIRYLSEQQGSAHSFLEANRAEQSALQSSLEASRQENEVLSGEKIELERQEQGVAEELALCREQHRLASREVIRREERIEEIRRSILNLSSRSAAQRNLEEQLKQRRQELKPRMDQLQLARQEAEQAIRVSRERLEVLAQEDREYQARLVEVRSLRNGLGEQRASLQEELDEALRVERDLNDRLIGLRERLQSLQEVEVNRSQYSEGVRKLLQHLGKSSVQAAGTLADRIETQPQFESLVEEFLDQQLEYVLVSTMDQAFAGLEELRGLKSGKCTFLSMQTSNGFGSKVGPDLTLAGKPSEGLYGTLADLLQMDEEVGLAFRRVLPTQAQAIVVSDLDRAMTLSHTYPESTFITLQGESLSPRGLLTSRSGGSRRLGLLSLKRQKRELHKKIEELEQRAGVANCCQADLRIRLDDVERTLQDCQSEVTEKEKSGIRLDHSREQVEREAARQQRSLKTVADEITLAQEEAGKLADRLTETSLQLSSALEQMQTAELSLLAEQGELTQSKIESQRVQDHLHNVDSKKQVLVERRTALEQILTRTEEQHRSLSRRLEKAQQESVRTEAGIHQLGQDLEANKLRQLNLARQDQDLQTRLDEAQKEYDAWRRAQPEHEQRLKSLRQKASELRETRAGLEVEQARVETQLHTLAEQCREQANAELDEISRGIRLDEVQRDQITFEFEDLRLKLEGFGPVNMTALDEYQENEERYTFLSTQRSDIEASIADTQKAIRDLNRRSRQRFEEAFEAVNRNFQEYFARLFGGGECGMRLLDEEDLLESGIDIFAQPPGKKLQNVMLLSGGEKALTVLALLMGLFAFRPSRFCVLDEVDAPLDDANVTRFAKLVREMSEKIQMILITHNKKTMEVADVLYGVTMQDPGVSQVVSVQF